MSLDFGIGSKLATFNAQNLLIAARDAGKRGNFGLGCSLAILATEETIKSIFCFRKYYFPNWTLPDFSDVFIKHLYKHKHIELAYSFIQDMLDSNKHVFPMYRERFESAFDEDGVPISNETKEMFSLLIDYMHNVANNPPKFTAEEVANWWGSHRANNLKNNGLYVGYKGDSWLDPTSIDEGTFNEAILYSQTLLNQALAFNILVISTEGIITVMDIADKQSDDTQEEI